MSYTYAVQVPVGKELDIKGKILNAIERLGNPGIIAIHALETFTQSLSNSGLSGKWKAKVPGYVFVTVSHTCGLEMNAECWQFIKRNIPNIKNILNQVIEQQEWDNFFQAVENLEPEIQLIEKTNKKPSKKELREYWNNLNINDNIKDTKTKNNELDISLTELIDAANKILHNKIEKAKNQAVNNLYKLVSSIKTKIGTRRNTHFIPHELFKIIESRYRNKGDTVKQMTVQAALIELRTWLKAVVN